MKKRIILIYVLFLGFHFYSFSQDSLACTKFKIGKFDTYIDGEFSSKVTRNEKYQKEYMPKTGIKIKLKIIWINDCSYKLIFVNGNKKYYQMFGKKNVNPDLIVTIIKVDGNEYYHESRFVGDENFVYKAKIVKSK